MPSVRRFSRLSFAAVAALALLAGTHAALDAADDSPSAAFERWVDRQARRALDDGARRRKAVKSAEEAQRHAEWARDRILAAMGGLPGTKTPLNARITGRLDREGYRIDALVFESLPGFYVTASLYVPDGKGPFPAVLGTAGHSAEGRAAEPYQHVWANLARRGVLVLAFDPPGQGERLQYFDPATGASRIGVGTPEHSHVGRQCLLTGTSIARYFVWDGVRALDYLLTRPDVDPTRIGVAGNSGGGTQAAWLGALEPRLAAIDSSCYITSWKELWKGSGPQDMEQVLPGFLSDGLDFADAIAAASPRPYLVSSARRDFFPIDGARDTVGQARRFYSRLDARDRVQHVEHDAEHGWSQPLREAAYRFFGQLWLGDTAPGPELDVVIETPLALRATKTGQVATSYDVRTIFDFNSERAEELARTRPRATAERLRAHLQVPAEGPEPRVVRRSDAAPVDGRRAERLVLETAPDLELPAVLIHPDGSPKGTVVIVDGREPGDAAAREAAGARWAARGYLALVMDLRGVGALGPSRGRSGYTADYQQAARAWLLGSSVVAWQTEDLIGALRLLEREAPDVSARVLDAAGLTVPAAIFAAALHPVTELRAADGIVSYLDLATTQHYQASARLFVPGILEVADLGDAMKLAAPAKVHLVRPKRGDGGAVEDVRELARLLGGAVPANVRLEAAESSPAW